MTPQVIISQIVSHLTTVIELAPAAEKDPEQLKDLLCSSAEFRVAARMLRGLEPYADSDEAEETKIDSPTAEQVVLVRKMLQETRVHFEQCDTSGFEAQHLVALNTMLPGAEEMANNIQQLHAA